MFYISTLMLRAGVEPRIKLVPQSIRPSRGARDSGVSSGVAAVDVLCMESKKHILDTIENVYKDPTE